MSMHFVSVVSILILSSFSCDGAKILFLPANINSHVLYFARLAEALSREGHTSHLYVPSNGQKISPAHEKFTVTNYPVQGDKPFMTTPEANQWFLQIAMTKSKLEQLQIMLKFAEKFLPDIEGACVSLLENRDLMQTLRNEKYDFAVTDIAAMNCLCVIPYTLNVPYSILSVAWLGWMYRMPQFPSSASLFGYTDRMSFSERLTTLLIEFSIAATMNTSAIYSQLYAPNREPLNSRQLFTRSSSWFIMEDLSLGYPRPSMPNTVSIGDLMTGQPVKPLPADLLKFISEAPDGVILTSFGSFFDYVPQDLAEKFCNVFRSLKQRVIWKMKVSGVCEGVEGVRLVSWMPQNDLLASPHVKLFITHAGFSSLAESLYHSKPLITFPIALDQPCNAASVAAKGYAIQMDLSDFTEEALRENIEKMLSDPLYVQAAKHHSAIMKHRTLTPGQRVSHQIEHIIRFGDAHLRSAAYDLSDAQFFMVDLFVCLFFALLVCLVSVCVCVRCVYTRCCRASEKKSVGGDKKHQ